MQRPVARPVSRTALRGVIRRQYGGLTLPRQNRVAFIPNAYPFVDKDGGDGITRVSGTGLVLTDGDTYTLPVSWQTAMGHVAGVADTFWGADDLSIAVTGATIKQNANDYNFIVSTTKGIGVYDVATQTSAIALKADKYLNRLPYNQPTAYFNGVDITRSTSFDSGTLGTNPGQWVLDNTGVLVNAGVDVPAMEGMRLDGTTWRDTTITGTPILPSVEQKTKTYDVDFITPVASTTFKKYTRTDPLVMPGYLSEPARTNKCTCRKANPIDTTGLVLTGGDANTTFSVVTETVEKLREAGLEDICTALKVYCLNNGAGAATAYVHTTAQAINTNQHYLSIYGRRTGAAGANNLINGSIPFTGVPFDTSNIYKRYEVIGVNAAINVLKIRAGAGQIVYFIIPQFEEGAFCTSPIAKLQDGTDPLTAITRAGTVLTYPTAGKIRSNNMAFRMTVVPRAGGQTNARLLSLYYDVNNNFDIIIGSTGVPTVEAKVNNVSSYPSVGSAYVSEIPIELLCIKTPLGIQLAKRTFGSGVWSIWTNSVLFTTAACKSAIFVPATYLIGGKSTGNQFTGNISELDTLFIPTGITDPLAWAKAQWGIS